MRKVLVIAGGIALCISIFIVNSCNKGTSNTATSGYVNVSVNTTYPQYAALNSVGNYIYIPATPNGGIRGIILYRYSFEQFLAFERSCTYNTPTECAPLVVVNALTIEDTCKICGSQFSILNGQVSKGPATAPLTQYKTSYDGTSIITITN